MNINIREYQQSDRNFIANSLEKMHDYLVKLDPIKRLRKEPGYTEHLTDDLFKNVTEKEGKFILQKRMINL
jgi:hypothetical protein